MQSECEPGHGGVEIAHLSVKGAVGTSGVQAQDLGRKEEVWVKQLGFGDTYLYSVVVR